MFSLESLRAELHELKGAKFSLIVIICAVALGVWLAAGQFYSERIEVLQQRLDLVAPPPATVTPPPVMLVPHVSLRVAIGLSVVFVGVIALAWRYWRLARRLRADSTAKDDLLKVAARLHGELTDQRDKAVVALKDVKHKHAMEVLDAYSKLKPRNGVQTMVTVRHASYDQDYDLAQQIKGLVTTYVKWPAETELSNKLQRAGKFKVVFDVATTYSSYAPLMQAISDLLDMPVGRLEWVERDDPHHVIVMVLPSAGAEPIKAVSV